MCGKWVSGHLPPLADAFTSTPHIPKPLLMLYFMYMCSCSLLPNSCALSICVPQGRQKA